MAAPAIAPAPTLSPDTYLRRWGFRIVSRPAVGEPLWRDARSRAVLPQGQAKVVAMLREAQAKRG